MFYVVIFLLLDVATCVYIVETENDKVFFNNSTDSHVLLICQFTEPEDIITVSWQRLTSAKFGTVLTYTTDSCFKITNNIQAIINCDKNKLKFSANVPIETISDGEMWRCFGSLQPSGNIGPSKAVQILSVVPIRGVIISNNTPVISVEEGKNVSLECRNKPACRPMAKLQWFNTIDRNIIDGPDEPMYEEVPTNSTLTVTKLLVTYTGKSTDNEGSLYCTANQSSIVLNSSLVRLNIIYPPSQELVLSLIPNGTLKENTTVNATCYIYGGNPLAKLELLCNKNLGFNYSTTSTAVSTLTFIATSLFNEKSCICKATHQVNDFTRNKSEMIEVQYAPTDKPTVTQFPPNPVFENDTVTLTCTVFGGNPLADLTWDCGTNFTNISSGNKATSSVSLLVSQDSNGKLCKCTASHPAAGYNQEVLKEIIVYYAPDLSISITQTPPGAIDTGGTLNLRCEVTGGNPLANLSWDCGTEITNNSSGNTSSISVRFKVDKTYNNKSCTCSAVHQVSWYSPTKQHNLDVNYPPSDPRLTMNPELPWFEANYTDIGCSVNDSGNPKSSFMWMWNNSAISSHMSNSYPVGPLKRTDNGATIACRVYNNYSIRKGINIQVNQSLNVEYYPIVILKNETVKVVEGQTLNTQCIILGNPIPKGHWLREGQEGSLLVEGEKINMTIPVVNRTDNGRYRCIAISESSRYGLLSTSKFIELIVNYPPDVHIDTNNQENKDDIVYVCNATGNPNKYTYMGWEQTYNDVVIRTSNQLEIGDNNKSLSLKKLSFWDSGNYTCFVNNGVPDRNGRFRQFGSEELNVKVSPQLLSGLPRDATYSTVKGGTITIDLKYVTFPDIIDASWYNVTSNSSIEMFSNNDIFFSFEKKTIETTFHGIKVNVSDFAYQAILKFDNFVAQMEGLYVLRLRNGYKDKDITVKAVISSKPEDPSNLNVTSRTSTTITVNWNRGYNGGHLQYFNISIFDSSGIRFTKLINDDYNETQLYRIAELTPSTDYVIHVYAFNKINSSNVIQINTTTNAEVSKTSENQFPVGAVAGGVVGLLIAAAVIMLIFIKRRWSTSGKGNSKKKSDRNILTSSGEEDDGDGLKFNDLYVSAGDDFNQSKRPGDVYAVVKKSSGREDDDNPDMKETALYAEVNKSKGVLSKGKSDTNVESQNNLTTKKKGKNKIEKARNDDVYENISEGNKKSISPPNKNKDGLVYADLVFNDNGRRKFVIRGIENKTDYADIDLNIKVDPLPSDESDKEDEDKPNGSNGVQETQ